MDVSLRGYYKNSLTLFLLDQVLTFGKNLLDLMLFQHGKFFFLHAKPSKRLFPLLSVSKIKLIDNVL